LGTNLRQWISAKGFWLVAAAALLPFVLTGAWVLTHRADVAVTELRFDNASLVEGHNVTFTAVVANLGKTDVGPFNTTLAVGSVSSNGLFSTLNSTDVRIDGLRAGETKEITLDWRASPGILYALAIADYHRTPLGAVEENVTEVDEYNNQLAKPLAVRHAVPSMDAAPKAPENVTGSANATLVSDLSLSAIAGADSPSPDNDTTYAVTVTNNGPDAANGTLHLRIASQFGSAFFTDKEEKAALDLAPGANRTLTLSWPAREGAYWAESWVELGADHRDPTPEDDHVARPVTVDRALTPGLTPPAPPEKLTIKEFYLSVLTLLHLRILLPLVALFYAAGVIADEKEKGTLPYLLTRPLPRWTIPLTKFAASFVVAAIATMLGLLVTYLLLFGTTPQGGDVGFLTTPILASLLALFVYGALFTLLGVWVERPYLVGLGFVLGWENVAPLLVPWVKNFTVSQHLSNALSGWHLDQGVQWMPDDTRAFYILVVAGVACLVGASAVMRQREFEV
jgi:hypothetical protein